MGFLHEINKRAASFWRQCTESVFHPVWSVFSRSQVWFRRLWITCLYLIGAGLWAFFLNFDLFENHGWFQQFDAQLMDKLIEEFDPSFFKETIFRYDQDGWKLSDRALCTHS